MSSEQTHSPTHKSPSPPVVPPLTGPGRLGIPISDDSSEDELSQIRALEEDQGIYYHEEVVVSPKNESDDDIPLRRFQLSHPTAAAQKLQELKDQAALLQQIESETPIRSNASRMERRGSVRFNVPPNELEEENTLHFQSPLPSPESLRYIRALENPMEASGDLEHEFEDLTNDPPEARPPLGSPPAYTSGDEGPNKQGNSSAGSNNNKKQGSLNEVFMNKVSQPFQNMIRRASRLEDDSDHDSDDDSSDDDDYSEDEIAVLTFIDQYKCNPVQLQPELRPFSIEYIAALGDVDLFIKVPRPDEIDDNVGLTHIDEPPSNQSDATIVDMQIRNAAKDMASLDAEVPVKLLEKADEKPDEIKKWIADIKDFHKTKPAQIVHYKTQMPDTETLMEEWNPQLEDALKLISAPSANLDVSLEKYVDICLNIFDIPVGASRIEGLHNLFSTLHTFNDSQHFRNLAVNNNLGGETGETMDRLEL